MRMLGGENMQFQTVSLSNQDKCLRSHSWNHALIRNYRFNVCGWHRKKHLKSPRQPGPSACCAWRWLFAAVIGSSVALLSVCSRSVRSNWKRAPWWQWRDSLARRVPLKRRWLTRLIVWETSDVSDLTPPPRLQHSHTESERDTE